MQEACTGVQFATTAFLTMCSSSISRKKKPQSMISVKDFNCGRFVFFFLALFYAIFKPFFLVSGAFAEVRDVLNRENAKIISGGVRATKCSAQA